MDKLVNNDILDNLILEFCLNSLLSGNPSFINLHKIFSSLENCEFNISKEDFKRRLFFLIGMEYITIEPLLLDFNEIQLRLEELSIIDENIIKKFSDIKNLNHQLYYNHILFGKITANGIRRQEELINIIESNKGIKGVLNRIKSYFSTILDYKYLIGIGLTGVCIILIFGFDIKISEYITKMPVLSSVIDTDTLEQFEEINENNDFYQSIVQEFSSQDSSSTQSGASRQLDSTIFRDVKVKKVSTNEQMFRIIGNDGKEQFITVKRGSDGKLQVSLPPKLKAIQDKIRNFKLINRQ